MKLEKKKNMRQNLKENANIILKCVGIMIGILLLTGPTIAEERKFDQGAFQAREVAESPKGTFQIHVENNDSISSINSLLCSDIDIIFILDRSGSMDTFDAVLPDGTTVSRLNAVKFAAKSFIDLLPAGTGTRVGIVSYESYGYAKTELGLTSDFTSAKSAVDSLITGGSTSIGEGIEEGINEFQSHGNTNKRIFVLLTDGLANDYPYGWYAPPGWIPPTGTWSIAELYTLYEADLALTTDQINPTQIYTIGVGYRTSINENLLDVIATSSGGKYFFAGTTSITTMFNEIVTNICKGNIDTLILANFQRMKNIGYNSISVDNLKAKLQDLAYNSTEGRGILIDLDKITSIKANYSNWNGKEGDITATNNLVLAIDNYIEKMKKTSYPKLKYVILVGSHEVLPMKARLNDYTWKEWWCYWDFCKINEKTWANDLPKKSGYVYDIYHAGNEGYYLTDTIYADLSYRDRSSDHELTPELAIGRLVETPEQIIKVIGAYKAKYGKITSPRYESMASWDYLDGGIHARDSMVSSGNVVDTLIQSAYASSNVPRILNANYDMVYFAGHGEYNWITTRDSRDGVSSNDDGFMAGNADVHGDTGEVKTIDGTIIITTGCHNGINFGNKKYHGPDNGTLYSEFPEEFAKKGVVAYLGATGYTAITGTGSSTNKELVGFSERIATNVVSNVVTGEDIGTAFVKGANDYYVSRRNNFDNIDRRVLAIPTLYGIPNYKIGGPKTTTSNNGVMIRDTQSTYNSEQIEITITNYSLSNGLVKIPGMIQSVSFNKPIIPVLSTKKILPYGSNILVKWNKTASRNITIRNDIPIAGISNKKISMKGNFSYNGFYPAVPYINYTIFTLGGGGSEVGITINPVQYNPKTNQTKIWTKMVFDVQYNIQDTGISLTKLTTDKYLYSPTEKMRLNVSIFNKGTARSVDLRMIMRDMNTSKEIITIKIGSMGLSGGTTSSGTYLINLDNFSQLKGKIIKGELIILNPNDDSVLATGSITFKIGEGINILKNPGLELSDGTEPTYWDRYQTGTKALFTYPEQGRIGGKSAAIKYVTKEKDKVALWWQPGITVNPSKQYKLSGYMKLTNVTGGNSDCNPLVCPRYNGASLRVNWLKSDGTAIKVDLITKSGTSAWTKYEKIFTAPSNAVRATVGGDLFNASGKVWFDDMSFARIS